MVKDRQTYENRESFVMMKNIRIFLFVGLVRRFWKPGRACVRMEKPGHSSSSGRIWRLGRDFAEIGSDKVYGQG